MKYRLFEGGYESFPDDSVPEEYRDIVVDKLPQAIIDADAILQQEAEERADYTVAIPDLVKTLQAEIEHLKNRVTDLEVKEITP